LITPASSVKVGVGLVDGHRLDRRRPLRIGLQVGDDRHDRLLVTIDDDARTGLVHDRDLLFVEEFLPLRAR
jgi:hypothetical protein